MSGFRPGERVAVLARGVCGPERYFFRVATGTEVPRKVDGCGDRVPHIYAFSEDNGQAVWLPVSELLLERKP